MTINIPIESKSGREQRPESSQARFDLKTIEVLTQKLQEIVKVAPAEQQAAFRDSLFAGTPTLTELLTRYDIQKDDDIATIVEKLTAVKENIIREAKTFRPKEEVEVLIERTPANDNGERERMMEIQEGINMLYQENQQIIEQQDQLKEEQVFLDLFANEKEEEDDDVRHTEMRIAQYEAEIHSLTPEETTGLFQRLLRKNTFSEETAERIQELSEKIMKAEEGLKTKYNQLLAKEKSIQNRFLEIKAKLGEPVTEAVLPTEWQELVQKTREALEALSAKLDEEYEKRQMEIKEQEAKRDSIANVTV